MQKSIYRKLNLVNLSKEISSVSTFIYTMIHTNLTFANTIRKHVIIKNLDYLFQNVFAESKA